MVRTFAPNAKGSGIPQVMAAIDLSSNKFENHACVIEKLINIVAKHNRDVANAISRTTTEDVHLFSLLQRGYIDSRYKKNYFIIKEELKKMIGNVERLQESVERIG